MNIPEPNTYAGPVTYTVRLVTEHVRYRRWYLRVAEWLGLIEPSDRWLARHRKAYREDTDADD